MWPFIADYGTLSAIYTVVRKAYAKRVYVDKEFQKKAEMLVREKISTYGIEAVTEFVEINAETIELIKRKKGGDNTKVINLVKSIEKTAEEASEDPFLIAMAERAKLVQKKFEQRQTSTEEALAELIKEVESNEARKQEQSEKGFDGLTFFVYRTLLDAGIEKADSVSRKIKQAFVTYPNWKISENELRDLRQVVTFAIFAESEDIDHVVHLVDELFTLLDKANRI